jgi:hypothetical protein
MRVKINRGHIGSRMAHWGRSRMSLRIRAVLTLDSTISSLVYSQTIFWRKSTNRWPGSYFMGVRRSYSVSTRLQYHIDQRHSSTRQAKRLSWNVSPLDLPIKTHRAGYGNEALPLRKNVHKTPRTIGESSPKKASSLRESRLKAANVHPFFAETPQITNGLCRFQVRRAYTVSTSEQNTFYQRQRSTPESMARTSHGRLVNEFGGKLGSSDFRSAKTVLNISFAPPDQLRSRKVVSRSNARPTGKYPSWKMNRMLHWESVNELNAFRLLDCDPKVKSFSEQPCEITFVQNGAIRTHFPDLLVEFEDRKEMWEVKTESDASKVDISERTAILGAGLPIWGYTYRVVLADTLKKQPHLANANLLLKYGRRPIDLWARESIRQQLKAACSLSWSAACAGTYGKTGRESICRLALEGVLTFDVTSPVTASTEFTSVEEKL